MNKKVAKAGDAAENKTEIEVIAQFTTTLPETVKYLAGTVAKNYTFNPILNYVCIVPMKKYICATDKRALRLINLEIDGEVDVEPNAAAIIDPKYVKQIAGKTLSVTIEIKKATVQNASKKGNVASTVKRYNVTTIECDSKKYVTEAECGSNIFPPAERVILPTSDMKSLKIAPESFDAIKALCKMPSPGNVNNSIPFRSEDAILSLVALEGESLALLHLGDTDHFCDIRCTIKLDEPPTEDVILGFTPDLFERMMDDFDGKIWYKDQNGVAPVLLGGKTEHSLLMPKQTNDEYKEQHSLWPYHKDWRPDSTVATKQTLSTLLSEVQSRAVEMWEIIRNDKVSQLNPGNWSAKDLIKPSKPGHYSKCGSYVVPADNIVPFIITDDMVNIKVAGAEMKFGYYNIFPVLWRCESAIKGEKIVFNAGDVQDVIRTVVTADGKGLVEKKLSLRVLGDGWYIPTDQVNKKNAAISVSIYVDVEEWTINIGNQAMSIIEDADRLTSLKAKYSNLKERILSAATKDAYFAAIAEKIGLVNSNVTEEKVSEEPTKCNKTTFFFFTID